jgi:hypothetical protein
VKLRILRGFFSSVRVVRGKKFIHAYVVEQRFLCLTNTQKQKKIYLSGPYSLLTLLKRKGKKGRVGVSLNLFFFLSSRY